MITVHSLAKRYKDQFAVDHISFEVRTGEIFGLLGPNGAGKTTTVEMLEGLKTITEGDAILNGISVKDHPREVKHRIGVQLQSSAYFEDMNLKELLEFFGKLYDRTIDGMQLLGRVALTDQWKKQAKQLSGGQRQRLSIAVALVNDPLVIFLDEPTTGLDPQARRNLWEVVQQLQKEGKTIVLTTHYMDEAEILCDRIAIMDAGKIIALDTPSQLLRKINHQATISFRAHDVDAQALKALTGVLDVVINKESVAVATTSVSDTLNVLFAHAKAHHFAMNDLQVRDTNLEDVFIALTGKQLRD